MSDSSDRSTSPNITDNNSSSSSSQQQQTFQSKSGFNQIELKRIANAISHTTKNGFYRIFVLLRSNNVPMTISSKGVFFDLTIVSRETIEEIFRIIENVKIEQQRQPNLLKPLTFE